MQAILLTRRASSTIEKDPRAALAYLRAAAALLDVYVYLTLGYRRDG